MYPEQQQPQPFPPQPQWSPQQSPQAPQGKYRKQRNPLLIASIILGLAAAGFAGFSAWAYMNYQDQKNNTDQKIEEAVTKSEAAQKAVLEKDFLEREKQPYTKFNGPDDLGHVTFDFPKTWSVYIGETSGNTFQAFLNPGTVPTVSNSQPYATRVVVVDKSYEDTLKSYESLVKKGSLKSAPVTVNGFTGVRLDGEFSKERKGSSVIFKVRDKTLLISTDAESFRGDFDGIILKSLDFNP